MPWHAGMYFLFIPCSIPCIKYDVKRSEEPPARILDFWWPNKCLCSCSLYTSLCVKLSAGGSVGICLVYVWMPNCMTVTSSRWEYNNETTEIQWIALEPCWLCSLIESDILKTQIILSIIHILFLVLQRNSKFKQICSRIDKYKIWTSHTVSQVQS